MATSNERIRDGMIRHEIQLLRFRNGLGRRLIKILDDAEPRLRERLKGRIQRAARIGFDRGPTTTKRLKELELAIARLMHPTWLEFREKTREELTELAKMESEFHSTLIAASLPVVVEPNLPNTATLKQIVAKRPFDGAVLRDWLGRIERNDRRRMIDQIREGVLFHETPVQISRRIFGTRRVNGTDGKRQITRRGALALAETAVSMVENGVKQEIYKKNKELIDEELYVATLDSRTSPICRSLDGNRYPVNEGPVPPVHINCRSIRVPIIEGRGLGTRPANRATEKDLEGLRGTERRRRVEELVGQAPADETYEVFLKKQSVDFQNEVLGPTRARLFRKGEVTLDQFVDQTGRQYTLEQLRQRLPDAF